MSFFSRLSLESKTARWVFLLAATLGLAALFSHFRVPASMLLSGMAVGVALSTRGRGLRLPKPVFVIAQGILGSVIARTMTPEAFSEIFSHWPLMFFMVVSTAIFSSILGWLLAKTRTLPGSTAIWGTSTGGALIMTVMSEEYGADSRLVAFMQYFRVILVTLVATLVVGLWGEPMTIREIVSSSGPAPETFDWFNFFLTICLALSGAVASYLINFSSAQLLFPLFLGAILNYMGWIHIVVPWWLMALSNIVIGWSIGLRFNREIIRHVARAFPKVFLTLLTLIALCGGLAYVAALATGMDPLTAYMATSPGGIDAIAILSVSMGGNMSFVMAAQTLRLILVIIIGPYLATFVARRTGFVARTDPKKNDK